MIFYDGCNMAGGVFSFWSWIYCTTILCSATGLFLSLLFLPGRLGMNRKKEKKKEYTKDY